MVGQREATLARRQLVQQLLDELEQVVDLLELAPRVLVELAFAREDVQFLEQFNRLPGADVRRQGRRGGGFPGHGWPFPPSDSSGVGPTPSAAQPSAPSLSRVAMLTS